MGLKGVQRDPQATSRTRRALQYLADTEFFVTGGMTLDEERLSVRLPALSGLEVAADGLRLMAIPFAKFANMTTDRLLGRDTAGTGDIEQLTVGNGLEFTGSGAIRIADNAVTDTRLRDSAGCSVIGRAANSIGPPADISTSTDGHYLLRRDDTVQFAAIAGADLPTATTSAQGACKEAAGQADPAALTSASPAADATYDATEAGIINALKADVVALRGTLNGLLTKLRNADQLAT